MLGYADMLALCRARVGLLYVGPMLARAVLGHVGPLLRAGEPVNIGLMVKHGAWALLGHVGPMLSLLGPC